MLTVGGSYNGDYAIVLSTAYVVSYDFGFPLILHRYNYMYACICYKGVYIHCLIKITYVHSYCTGLIVW